MSGRLINAGLPAASRRARLVAVAALSAMPAPPTSRRWRRRRGQGRAWREHGWSAGLLAALAVYGAVLIALTGGLR